MPLLLSFLLLAVFRPASHSLTIRFSNEVGGRPLRLGGEIYVNRFGEPFTVTQCKYYISHLVAGDGRREELLFFRPHLVDQGDSGSLELHLQTTLAAVRWVRFSVGVDSIYNTAGVLTGDLDPMLGMFWTWNTGYINARLEGISDSARAPAHRFTWDVGGYRSGQNTLRTVTILLPADDTIPAGGSPDKPADRASATPEIVLHANLLHWFDGLHFIPIGVSPVCHEPGPLAMQLADNISTLFSAR
jgi:hypothetical protein